MENQIGSKYNAALTTTQIAKLVREDIKAAVKGGELPKARYSVRTSYYSMGSSLNITIKDVLFNLLNEARVLNENHLPECFNPKYTPKAEEVLKKLQAILDTYNRKRIDSQQDVYNVKFSGWVQFDSDIENSERDIITLRASALKWDSAKPSANCHSGGPVSSSDPK